jgi:hypothetical protein
MGSNESNPEDPDGAFAALFELFSKPIKSPQKAYRTYQLTFENGEPNRKHGYDWIIPSLTQTTTARDALSAHIVTIGLSWVTRVIKPMSGSGQNRKSSMRANVFRFAPESGHRTTRSACPVGAKNRPCPGKEPNISSATNS